MVPPAVPGSWGHSAKGGIFSRSETDLMTQCFLYMHLFSEDLRIIRPWLAQSHAHMRTFQLCGPMNFHWC